MIILLALCGLFQNSVHTYEIQLVGCESSCREFQLHWDDSLAFPASGYLKVTVSKPDRSFEILGPGGNVYYIGVWEDFGSGSDSVVRIEIDISQPHVAMYQLVTANRSKQMLLESPAEVSVIALIDQPESHTLLTTDILKEHPQVHIQKTNLGGGSPIIRGMSGNRILYLVDGFKVNNGTFRLGLNQYLNGIPLEMMGQIEVMGGPSGVQYGSDGLGGTIQFLTRDPFNQSTGYLEYNQTFSSADDSHMENLRWSQHHDSLVTNGHLKFSSMNDLRAGSPVGEQVPTGFDQWDGSFTIGWEISENQRLTLMNLGSVARDVPRTDRIWSGKDLVWTYDPQNYQIHALKWKNDRANVLCDSMETGLAWSRQKEGRNRVSSRHPELFEKNLSQVDTLQGFISCTRFFQKGQLVYGVDFQRDVVSSEASTQNLISHEVYPGQPKFPDDSKYGQSGVFAIGTFSPGGDVNLRMGLRYAETSLSGTLPEPFLFQSRSFHHLSPVFSYSVKTGEHFYSFSASNGFRSPNLEDSFSLGPSNKGFDAPNPELQPETTWNYDFTYRLHQPGRFLQFTAFYASYQDLIERVPGTYNGQDTYEGEKVYILENVGSAEVQGASISLNQRIHGDWNFYGTSVYTRGTQTEIDEPMTRIPPLKVRLELRKKAKRSHFSVKVDYAAKQDRLSPDDKNDSRIPWDGTPSFLVAHLQASWDLSSWLRFSASFENLGNKLYKQHGSGIYEPGRRVVLQFQAKKRIQ